MNQHIRNYLAALVALFAGKPINYQKYRPCGTRPTDKQVQRMVMNRAALRRERRRLRVQGMAWGKADKLREAGA